MNQDLIEAFERRAERGDRTAAEVAVARAVAEADHRLRRRRLGMVLGVAGLVAIVAVAVGVWSASDPAQRVQVASPDVDPTTWPVFDAGDLTLRAPPSWNMTTGDLTPNVLDPRVVISAGTGELAAGGGDRCAQFPMQAVQAMAPDGALVVVLERAGRPGPDVPVREGSLWDLRGPANHDESPECLSDPPEFTSWWWHVADRDRQFYVYVAVGPEAGPDRIEEVRAVVDSLDVAPR